MDFSPLTTTAYLGGEDLAECFAPPAMLAHMLQFEATLASAQAALGLIPRDAAALIAQCAQNTPFDLANIAAQSVEASNPAIPLVHLLTLAVEGKDAKAARYVHWGSTSQDVMDSALMMAARVASARLNAHLDALIALLCPLAERHRTTLMPARTLSQHAGPTTFGLKVAGWLLGLLGARARMLSLQAILPVQCGGATGTLASFGTQGLELALGLATGLGLSNAGPWQTERTVVRELASGVANVAAAVGKIAHDIVLMAQTEVAELREATSPGRGGSSALPHKQNPVGAIAAGAAARRAPGALATVFAAFDQSHERASGAWHAESCALVDLFVYAGGALAGLRRSLAGIEVDTQAMRRNFDLTLGLLMSEAVSRALTPALGRTGAQALVAQASAVVRAEGRTLGAVLGESASVREHLGAQGLAQALDPYAQLGSADRLISGALARATAG